MAIKHFRNFCRATDGNVALITAFAIIPILILVGSVIDYSRGLRVKTVLQAAVDAAALNTARQSPGLTTAQMLVIAQNSVAAAFSVNGLGDPVTTLDYTAAGKANATIKVSASVIVPNTFMSLFGFASTGVAATSTSTWGSSRLRVALALDNTGSMDEPKKIGELKKMDALKTATKNLLTSLQNAAGKDGDVLVSIIPFARTVNVGASNRSASWISWNTQNCYWPTTWQRECFTPRKSTWNGAIMDRDQDYDISNTLPTNTMTTFRAGVDDDTPTSMMSLTSDWTALNNKVDAMISNGGTNQEIGMAWAWQALTPGLPMSAPAKDEGYKYSDIIIILSDGLNTINRWDGNGRSYEPKVDARQKLLCDNAKNAGIIIYAVQVNTDNADTAEALKSCASDPSKFTKLTKADQIVATFASIGASLSQLRLSK